MDKDKLLEIIDETIKNIWENEIACDYDDGWLLKEDSLKNAFYFHLRTKLGRIFYENDIRIYTEFTDDKFNGTRYRPDMVIVKVDFDKETDLLKECVEECLCVIEFKFKAYFKAQELIYKDFEKLKEYVNKVDNNSKLYMGTIWECEDDPVNWERKNSAWAKNRLTELNASYKRGTNDMQFYIVEH